MGTNAKRMIILVISLVLMLSLSVAIFTACSNKGGDGNSKNGNIGSSITISQVWQDNQTLFNDFVLRIVDEVKGAIANDKILYVAYDLGDKDKNTIDNVTVYMTQKGNGNERIYKVYQCSFNVVEANSLAEGNGIVADLVVEVVDTVFYDESTFEEVSNIYSQQHDKIVKPFEGNDFDNYVPTITSTQTLVSEYPDAVDALANRISSAIMTKYQFNTEDVIFCGCKLPNADSKGMIDSMTIRVARKTGETERKVCDYRVAFDKVYLDKIADGTANYTNVRSAFEQEFDYDAKTTASATIAEYYNCYNDSYYIQYEEERCEVIGHNFVEGVCSKCGAKDPTYWPPATNGLELMLNEDGNSYSVVGLGSATDRNIIIPKEYEGKPVTGISRNAFWSVTSIYSLMIPNTVTSIGNSAFENCRNLESIAIPDSVEHLGSDLLSGCSSLESLTVSFIGADIEHIDVLGYLFGTTSYTGSTATTQNSNTYYIPTSLKTVVFSGKVIANNTFYGCANITSITFANGFEFNGSSIFNGCNNLSLISVNNLENVESVHSALWSGHNAKIEFVGDADNTSRVAKLCGSNKYNVTIVSGNIGERAFLRCTGLTSITIPNSVTSIGREAFSGCTGLTSITIPNSVTSIGGYVFSGCSGLTSVTIPDSVTGIGREAFSGCTGLTSITIPDSVTSIDNSAFSPSGLQAIIVDGNNPNYSSQDGVLYNKAKSKIILVPHINGAVTIPDSVTSIGSGAFYGCTGLTSINIPDSVTSIGYDAFYGCSGLTSVTIPDSVTSIGEEAFSGCTGLTSITIGNSVTSIGGWAFLRCTGLTSIYYTGDIAGWCSIAGLGGLMRFGSSNKKLYISGEEITGDLTIPDSVTSIGDYAFYYRTGLTSITIGNSVTSIGYDAFYGCSGLTSVTIPNSVTSIGAGAFASCNNLESFILEEGSKLRYVESRPNDHRFLDGSTKVQFSEYKGGYYIGTPSNPFFMLVETDRSFSSINENTRILSGGSFSNYPTNLYIPASVWYLNSPRGGSGVAEIGFVGLESITFAENSQLKEIGVGTFYSCTSLTSITIPNSVTSIGDIAFERCTGLTSVTIPDSVTSIGAEAFEYCTGLTSITIGNSVTSIGDGAFHYCTGLTSITIPNSVTSIGTSAFKGCSLTSITIPNSVTSIGASAFYGCSSLTSITFEGTQAQWNAISKGSNWNYITGNYTVHCTDGDI